MEQLTELFVYGTLKRGQDAHFLMENTTYLGEAEAFGILYGKGNRPYPVAVFGGTDHKVMGERYRVDSLTLEKLDRYEGHPNLYKREIHNCWLKSGGPAEKVWMYSYQKSVEDYDVQPSGRYA